VIGAVAQGDLSQTMALEVDDRPLEGEFLRTAKTRQQDGGAALVVRFRVTRVAREVGTDGKLGGQAKVRGVAGTWKDLTDSVNSMASNLTSQVRNIADVTTAVADGRPFEEDHGGREGRGAGTEEHHQHDGGPAPVLRFRGDARCPRVGTEGKLGGQAVVEASPARGRT
jgi:hypothetical protein